ncbi:MAG TPA: hypothetical protein VM452_01385 [Caulifigura sp.]|nr:hypothetical protein [Caulifigura sp.]
MLRAAVAVCLVLAVYVPLCGWALSPAGRPQDSRGQLAVLVAVESTESGFEQALELEHLAQQDDPAARELSVAVVTPTAVGRLVTGRLDRDATHLELLLTCGRLVI